MFISNFSLSFLFAPVPINKLKAYALSFLCRFRILWVAVTLSLSWKFFCFLVARYIGHPRSESMIFMQEFVFV